MVIMKSFLHFVLVFLSWISYFSPDFKDVQQLLKYHCNLLSLQSFGLTPTRHFKLTLVLAVTETSGEEIFGAVIKPIFEIWKYYKKNNIFKQGIAALHLCSVSTALYPVPPILSPEYLCQCKYGKWQMGHHDDHAFLLFDCSCPSTFLLYVFSPILFSNTLSLMTL